MTTVLALTAFKATFGLVVVFLILFPIVVQGLIAFALATAMGERRQNLEHLESRGKQTSQG